MAYTVKAPLVIAKNNEGGDIYVYEGGLVPDGQSDEWVKFHLESEMIAEGAAPAAGADGDDSADGPPAKGAPKAEWVSYAVSQHADQDDAEAMTKKQLIEQYGDD